MFLAHFFFKELRNFNGSEAEQTKMHVNVNLCVQENEKESIIKASFPEKCVNMKVDIKE